MRPQDEPEVSPDETEGDACLLAPELLVVDRDFRRPLTVLPLDARRLVWATLAGAALLAFAHFVATIAGSAGMVTSVLALLNLDQESSFGTWFGACLLMINVALLLLLVAASADRMARRR